MLILSQEAPKQLASSVVTGDDSAQARVLNASNKNLSGGEETRRQHNFVRKLAKHSQKTLNTGRLHGGKYLCKNLGVEEGGGRFFFVFFLFVFFVYETFMLSKGYTIARAN